MIKRSQLEQPEEPKSVELYCPHLKCGGTVNILKCLYRCPKARIIKCAEYARVYPTLVNFTIEQKYIDKYGEIVIPIPICLRKRRKRREIIK